MDGKNPEETFNHSGKHSTRRSFIKTVGKASAAASISHLLPSRVFANALNSPSTQEIVLPDTQLTDFNWERLENLLASLKSPTQEQRTIIQDEISLLKEYYSEFNERIDLFDALEQKDPNDPLVTYFNEIKGDLKYASFGDMNPFRGLKNALLTKFQHFSLMLGVTDDFEKDNIPLAKIEIKELVDVIQKQYQQQDEEEASFRTTLDGISFEVKDHPELAMDKQTLFKQDAERILRFIKTYIPNFKNLYSKIIFTSNDRYGVTANSTEIAGTFHAERENIGYRYFGEIEINLDNLGSIPEFFDTTVAHEVTHATSVEINIDLAHHLSVDQLKQRYIREQQVAGDRVWGNKDRTIQQLFERRPRLRGNPGIYSKTSGVQLSQEQFIGLITEYPASYLLSNWHQKEYRKTQKNGKENIEEVELTFFDVASGNIIVETDVKGKTDDKFNSLHEFQNSFLSKYEDAANKGDNRAQIIVWGIKNYVNFFNNTDLLGGKPLTSQQWIDYCNSTVVNGVIYHAFLNKSDQNDVIRNLFTIEEQKNIERWILYARLRYREELLAEGTAYSLILGSRIEQTPYISLFKEANDMFGAIARKVPMEEIKDQTELLQNITADV